MESLARISSLVESARDLTIDAAQAARSSRASTKPLDKGQIKKLLDSRNEREVLDGLRRVIAAMYRTGKTHHFFSSVVKNVASPNLEIKKLVYIYLLHHAEAEPDLALLSINTIQKSLSDPNAHVRALALRTMSGIRVPVISQIVALAIKKGVTDMSPHVRRAAALAIPKCFRLDPAQLPALVDQLATLLGDRQYFVAGAAVAAFEEVCPERIGLVHPVYRGLVRKIVDMDEWSQLAAMRMMTRYARLCFPRRKRKRQQGQPDAVLDEFYSDGGGGGDSLNDGPLDPDLELFLSGIKPLLQSRNSAVVIAVARTYAAVGTSSYLAHAIGPLVALLRGPHDVQQIALHNVVSVCLVRPASFVQYATHFLVHATDPPPVWELKLEILALVFPHSPPRTKSLILHELEHFARGSGGPALIREAVRAIGRCAQASADRATAARCMKLLLGQITSLDGTLAAESLTVIRHLIQLDPDSHVGTVVRLAKNLDSATDPQARATIIWLVGEFSGLNGEDNIAADVLRILLKDFASEAEAAKQQIVLLAAKVYLHHLNRQANNAQKGADDDGEGSQPEVAVETHVTARLWEYVLLLVRYDTSYDLRDRARMYRALLAVPQLATLTLLAPKPAPQAQSPSEARKGFVLGSSTLVLAGAGGLHGIRGYEPLPAWVEDGRQPDPTLRGDVDGKAAAMASTARYGSSNSIAGGVNGDNRGDGGGSGGVSGSMGAAAAAAVAAGVGAKSLDDWLAEGEEEEKRLQEELQKLRQKKQEQQQQEEEEEEESEDEDEEDEDDEESEDDDDDEDEDEEDSDEEDEEEEESGGETDRLVPS